jgi:hypothetical protein
VPLHLARAATDELLAAQTDADGSAPDLPTPHVPTPAETQAAMTELQTMIAGVNIG